MTLDTQKMKFEIVPSAKATLLRENFIKKFVDITSDYYRKHIAPLREYADGHVEPKQQPFHFKGLLFLVFMICFDISLSDKLRLQFLSRSVFRQAVFGRAAGEGGRRNRRCGAARLDG